MTFPPFPRSSEEKHQMQKLSTAPLRAAKKAGMKREGSPCTPYKRKARGKETRPGSYKNILRPRACVRARYAEAGAAADELIAILGGQAERDRRIWAFYCRHFDIGIIFDLAYECASLFRQGEIRNPVTAFQHKLASRFPKGGAK